jgi:hypothetical protein
MAYKKHNSENEERVDIAAETAEAYAAVASPPIRTGEFHIPKELDPGIGPYSMEEIDEQLAEADRTLRDRSQWSTLDEIISDFKQEHVAWFR